MANPMGKTRPESDPYLTVDGGNGFIYKVLKAYAADPDKQYARWFLSTTSPYTHGSGEMGDGYIAEVTGRIVQRDPSVPDEALPSHLRGGAIKNPDPLGWLLG